jgi:Glu-tRNA(Gln) amidotransferase subunit E-like FAD-binding protein
MYVLGALSSVTARELEGLSMIRELAKKAAEMEQLEGDDAKQVLEIMMSDQKWKLGVALSLEYLNRGKKDEAKEVLEALLSDE